MVRLKDTPKFGRKRRDAGETLASIANSYAVNSSMISRLKAF